ncbi:hypothetical protein DSO57_1009293 [Entomophthora muscae]|uniref:Uncharacterized protein n=1 Tax=Entomophthora muscae TaxID=34485 RepID=A0ACC2USG8_9FUNG|nr:hypothetical protein DSO57_1009293 [Entomophthora muscae]
MPSLLRFKRAKFGVLCVETAAAIKEVPTSTLKEVWNSLEVTKTIPAGSLVEVKIAFKELYSNYFAKEGTPIQGNHIYGWDAWNLLVGWDEILQQVNEMTNREIEALRAREGKSVEIMACWQDDNKVLSKKIASLEAKLLKALSQEGNSNKSQGQDNGRMDWLGLDPSHILSTKAVVMGLAYRTISTWALRSSYQTQGRLKEQEAENGSSDSRKLVCFLGNPRPYEEPDN